MGSTPRVMQTGQLETIVARAEQEGRVVKSLALDLIAELGSEGEYISSDRTLHHFRDELLTPNLIHREPRESWEGKGRPTMEERAREKVHHILATHQPPPLADKIIEQLDEMLADAKPIVRET